MLHVMSNGYKLTAAVTALLLALAAPGGAQDNLARDKSYLCTTELLPGWTGLVDGLNQSDQAPGCFATDNSANFPKEVIIDLGGICQVTQVKLYNSLNGNTRHIAVLSSINARDFQPLREYYFPPDKIQPLVHSFPARRARYIKVTMFDTWTGGVNGDNCLYLREVEAYGNSDDSLANPASPPDVMALARWQQPLVKPYSVRLFRRYCLEGQSDITVGVLGDSFAGHGDEEHPTWLDLFINRLKYHGDYQSIEVIRSVAEPGVDSLAGARKELANFTEVDLLIISYGTQAALDAVPTLQFRRQLQELVSSAQQQVPALIVMVTPAPFAHHKELARYAQVEGKDSMRLALANEQVASLTGSALVRTASILAYSQRDITELYDDNVALSQLAHLAVSHALEELLW